MNFLSSIYEFKAMIFYLKSFISTSNLSWATLVDYSLALSWLSLSADLLRIAEI